MKKQEILAKVDHTLLKADAGWEDIRRICDEALENSTASICINPCWVERAVEYLGGRVPALPQPPLPPSSWLQAGIR